jgi:hypothetical protein
VIPTSSILAQVIAIVQLVLTGRQLYLNYDTSIKVKGLASLYLAVVPYLSMTLINFVVNIIVGSYAHVVVLPRDCPGPITIEGPQRSAEEFVQWITTHHSDLEEESLLITAKPPRSRIPASGSLFLVATTTLVVGLLSHFRASNWGRAGWLLAWIYGMAIWRLTLSLATSTFIDLKLFKKRWVNIIMLPFTLSVWVGIFGGVAIIGVELLEDMCNSEWAIDGITGFGIAAYAGLVVFFIQGVLGAILGIPSISCF